MAWIAEIVESSIEDGTPDGSMVARLRLLISFYDDTKRDDTESHKTFYFGQGELALASIQAAVVTEGQRLRDLNTKSNSLANNPALQPGNKITIP